MRRQLPEGEPLLAFSLGEASGEQLTRWEYLRFEVRRRLGNLLITLRLRRTR